MFKRQNLAPKLAVSALLALSLSACVSVPNFGSDDADYERTAAQIKEQESKGLIAPSTDEAPARKASYYDKRARQIMKLSSRLELDEGSIPVTAAQMVSIRDELLALVNAYKADDPI